MIKDSAKGECEGVCNMRVFNTILCPGTASMQIVNYTQMRELYGVAPISSHVRSNGSHGRQT